MPKTRAGEPPVPPETCETNLQLKTLARCHKTLSDHRMLERYARGFHAPTRIRFCQFASRRPSARQGLARLGCLCALLAALAGCQHRAADDAQAGQYGFEFVCESEEFKGHLDVAFAGDNRLPPRFLNQTFAESAGSDRGVAPARTPLPHEIDATLTPDKGAPRKFHLTVPSVDGRRDYLDDLYVVVEKDNTVAVKITLNPLPLNKMNKLSEDEHRFAYTLLPDDADPKYQQYRALCEAAFHGKLDTVDRLIAGGTPLAWPDPRTPSVVLCGRDPKLVALLLKHTSGRLKPETWFLANMAAVALQQDDCAACDVLLQAAGKDGLTEKRKVHLVEYACYAPSAEPMRHLIEDLHFDPNMTMNNPGQNPLYVAVISGNVPAAKYLLTKTNADPNLGLPRFSALDMAETAEHFHKPYGTPLVQLLRAHGARETPRGPQW
jgi:hypothetical protein